MIRHTAVAVEPGVCYGRSDVALKATFPEEAEAVRRSIADEIFDEVWCSPLSRCVKLAEACGHADARLDERLLEIDFGAWELQRFDEIDDPQLQRWYDDYLHERPTCGESFDDQCRRVADFLEERRREASGKRVLIFTHGGVLLAAGLHAGLFRSEEAFSRQTPYGGLLRFSL